MVRGILEASLTIFRSHLSRRPHYYGRPAVGSKPSVIFGVPFGRGILSVECKHITGQFTVGLKGLGDDTLSSEGDECVVSISGEER